MARPVSTRVAVALSLVATLAASAAPQSAKSAPPNDPRVDDGVVFVKDLVGDAEGAPPAKNLGKLVVLTDLAKGDPWYALVTRLAQAKKAAAVISFPNGEPERAKGELLRELPEFALVVTKPDHLDVNFHFALLETLAALDADPFVDVAFGYVTGATLEEAKGFVERFLALEAKKTPLPQKVIDFGPAAAPPSNFTGPYSDPVAKGWLRWNAYHRTLDEIVARRELLKGAGLLHAGGHGLPEGIDDGLKGKDLRALKLDLAPALYFSGPCYCGVTSGWFAAGQGGVERRTVKPEESFALAALAQGVSALFAGFDPDRGETCSQEQDHLLVHGDALGYASKESYDGVVVARRQEKFELFRYVEGKPMPHKDLVDTMTGGGACRALFGDPTWHAVPQCAQPVFDVKKRDSAKALELTWSSPKPDLTQWTANDVYHCEGGWTHRIAFTVEIPVATARALKKFEVKRLTAHETPLEFRFPTAMVERHGGKALLHVYLVFPPRGQQNVFLVEHDFDALFAFAK
jgi:hypothetical protein